MYPELSPLLCQPQAWEGLNSVTSFPRLNTSVSTTQSYRTWYDRDETYHQSPNLTKDPFRKSLCVTTTPFSPSHKSEISTRLLQFLLGVLPILEFEPIRCAIEEPCSDQDVSNSLPNSEYPIRKKGIGDDVLFMENLIKLCRKRHPIFHLRPRLWCPCHCSLKIFLGI